MVVMVDRISGAPTSDSRNWDVSAVAARIQHTLVSPDANEADIHRLCEDCLQHNFDGAMVQPCWVPLARSLLGGSSVKVCTAFGYPMGGDGLFTKVAAVRDCVAFGADEINFMPNLGFLKSGYLDRLGEEIATVVRAAEGRVVMVMLELGMLSDEEGRRAAELSIEAGVAYVKNSSGYGKGGKASVEVVNKLKRWVGDRVKIKASGGIRTFEQAVALLEAGADLLGTSASVAIVRGDRGKGEY